MIPSYGQLKVTAKVPHTTCVLGPRPDGQWPLSTDSIIWVPGRWNISEREGSLWIKSKFSGQIARLGGQYHLVLLVNHSKVCPQRMLRVGKKIQLSSLWGWLWQPAYRTSACIPLYDLPPREKITLRNRGQNEGKGRSKLSRTQPQRGTLTKYKYLGFDKWIKQPKSSMQREQSWGLVQTYLSMWMKFHGQWGSRGPGGHHTWTGSKVYSDKQVRLSHSTKIAVKNQQNLGRN